MIKKNGELQTPQITYFTLKKLRELPINRLHYKNFQKKSLVRRDQHLTKIEDDNARVRQLTIRLQNLFVNKERGVLHPPRL